MYEVIFFTGGITKLKNLFNNCLQNGGYIIFENVHYPRVKKMIREFVCEFYKHLNVLGLYGYETQFIIQKKNT